MYLRIKHTVGLSFLLLFVGACSSVQDSSKKQVSYSEYDVDLSQSLEDFEPSIQNSSANKSQQQEISSEEGVASLESAVSEPTNNLAENSLADEKTIESEFEQELSEESGSVVDNSVNSEEDLANLFEQELQAEENAIAKEKTKTVDKVDESSLADKDGDSLEEQFSEISENDLAQQPDALSKQEGVNEGEVADVDSALDGPASQEEDVVADNSDSAQEDKDKDGFMSVKDEPEVSFESVDISEPKRWVPVKKMAQTPFTKNGKLANAIYFARPQETLKGIARKIYGSTSEESVLLKINPHFQNKTLKVGDKVYYSSPLRPSDNSQILTYFEELNLPSKSYVSKNNENIRSISQKLLGNSGSWKEVWASNSQIESKGELSAGTVIRYWGPDSHKIALYERIDSGSNPTTVAQQHTDLGRNSQYQEVAQEAPKPQEIRDSKPAEVKTLASEIPSSQVAINNNQNLNQQAPEVQQPQQAVEEVTSEMIANNESSSEVPENYYPEEQNEAPAAQAQNNNTDNDVASNEEASLGSQNAQTGLIDYAAYAFLGIGVLGMVLVTVSRKRKVKKVAKKTSPSSVEIHQDEDKTQVTQVG